MKLTDHQYNLLREKLTHLLDATNVWVRTDPPSGQVIISVFRKEVPEDQRGDFATKLYSITPMHLSPMESLYDNRNKRYVFTYDEDTLAKYFR